MTFDIPQNGHFIRLESIDSTNTYAKTLAGQGCPSGTVVTTRIQTAGRGRLGNIWISSEGNLFMSVVLKPTLMPKHAGQLSFLTAVAAGRVLQPFLSSAQANLYFKWPNDIFVNNRKIAGILLETELNTDSSIAWVVIGLGINIVQAPIKAICLKDLGIHDITSDFLLEKTTHEIFHVYERWQRDGFSFIREEWLKHMLGLNRETRIRLPQETFIGTALGIDDVGALRLRLQDGQERFVTSGEVFIDFSQK